MAKFDHFLIRRPDLTDYPPSGMPLCCVANELSNTPSTLEVPEPDVDPDRAGGAALLLVFIGHIHPTHMSLYRSHDNYTSKLYTVYASLYYHGTSDY